MRSEKYENNRNQMLLDQILFRVPCPIFWKDLTGVFLGCNKSFLDICGFDDYSQLIGKSDAEMSWASLKDEYAKDDQYVIITGETIIKVEQIALNGRVIVSETTKTPLLQKDKIIGVLGICLDITAKKEAEDMKVAQHQRDLELLKSEAHKNKIMQEFGVIAAKVAHDISSPLMVANASLNKLKDKFDSDDEHLKLIEQSLQDIKNIGSKILTTYREITGSNSKIKLHKIDDGNIKRYVLLSGLLESLVGFKKIEWQNNPCKLELNLSDKTCNLFIFIAPTEFNRSISNLLNNAYESLGKENRDISVELDINLEDKLFILTIKDNGFGIAEDKIESVLVGESTKHEGDGLGLSGAKFYFESIGGTLELFSIIKAGTRIDIKLPIAKDPEWFERVINYKSETSIVVLDDSSSIISLWQRILSDLNLPCTYFMNVNDFMPWYEKQNNRENIILFVDYDLGHENFTGLDIINKVTDLKSYLVTNHAEEAWLQDTIKQNLLKLIPKKLLEKLFFVNY